MNEAQKAVLSAALELARQGWQVLPVKRNDPKGKKPPYTDNGLKDATTNEATIRDWWETWPDANVGVLLRDLFLLDVDMKPGGGDGLASLKRFHAEHGQNVYQCWERSGGGGRHIFFRMPGRQIKHQGAVKDYPGLEVWHGDRYVVVAPSIHASGKPYEWGYGSIKLTDVPRSQINTLDLPPAVLLELIESRRKSKALPKRAVLEHLEDILPAVRDGEGRNDTVFRELFPACVKDNHTKADIAAKLPEIVAEINKESPLSKDPYTLSEAKESLESFDPELHKSKRKTITPTAFRVDTSGVYANDEEREIRISGSVELLSEVRDEHSKGWSKLFRIRNRDGRDVELLVPSSLLYQPAKDVLSRFVESGLEIEATSEAERLFVEYLKSASTEARRTLVSRIGWHGDQFVLPDRVIGANPAGEEQIVYQGQGLPHSFNTLGTADNWRSTIAARCAGNSRLVLGVSAAFAAPALHLLGSNGLGIHYRGVTSCGKTTALKIAGSVLGGGATGFVKSWRATGNALEGVALGHNHCLLALDEIGEADPKSIGQTAYMLSNGSGKARMRPDISQRPVAEWNLLFLSSGEKSLSEAVADGPGQHASTLGGQELRLIDLPADAGAGFGLFEKLPDGMNARDFAEELNRAASENYGTAFVAWLELLAARGSTIVDEIKRDVASFMQERGEMSAEVGRVAGLFAVIGAAGEAARGITGWPEREALRAARICFKAWLAGRGTKGGFDAERGVKQVRLFIQLHGSSSRFQGVGINEHGQEFELRSVNRLGYKREKPPGKWEFWILPEPWRDEICKGLDATSVAKELAERKLLLTDGRNLKVKRNVPEVGEMRVHVLKGEILDEGDTEEEQGEQSELWQRAA